MFKRIGQLLLTVALIAAIGGHWAVLQTVAWTTMFAANLRDSSFTQAVAKTFNGDHPCKLCHEISAGKKSEKKTEFQFALKKLEFTFGLSAVCFFPPQEFYLLDERSDVLPGRANAPPLPPPRKSLT